MKDDRTVSGRIPSKPEFQFTRTPKQKLLPHQRQMINIILQKNFAELEMRIIENQIRGVK